MTIEQFNKKYKYQTDKERFNTSLDNLELPKVGVDLELEVTKISENRAFVSNNR